MAGCGGEDIAQVGGEAHQVDVRAQLLVAHLQGVQLVESAVRIDDGTAVHPTRQGGAQQQVAIVCLNAQDLPGLVKVPQQITVDPAVAADLPAHTVFVLTAVEIAELVILGSKPQLQIIVQWMGQGYAVGEAAAGIYRRVFQPGHLAVAVPVDPGGAPGKRQALLGIGAVADSHVETVAMCGVQADVNRDLQSCGEIQSRPYDDTGKKVGALYLGLELLQQGLLEKISLLEGKQCIQQLVIDQRLVKNQFAEAIAGTALEVEKDIRSSPVGLHRHPGKRNHGIEIAPLFSQAEQTVPEILITAVMHYITRGKTRIGNQTVECPIIGSWPQYLDTDFADVHGLSGLDSDGQLPHRVCAFHLQVDGGAVVAQGLQAPFHPTPGRGQEVKPVLRGVRGRSQPGQGIAFQFALKADHRKRQVARLAGRGQQV